VADSTAREIAERLPSQRARSLALQLWLECVSTAEPFDQEKAAKMLDLALADAEARVRQEPTFHPKCLDCGGDAPVDHAFAVPGAPDGFKCVRCGAKDFSARLASAEQERDRLKQALANHAVQCPQCHTAALSDALGESQVK